MSSRARQRLALVTQRVTAVQSQLVHEARQQAAARGGGARDFVLQQLKTLFAQVQHAGVQRLTPDLADALLVGMHGVASDGIVE